jgi:hypothetical protein
MTEPSEIQIRLLLNLQDGTLRKFYWFKRTANDFYWGSSFKSGNHIIPFTNQTSVTFQIPTDFDSQEKVSSKYSFHESGTVHHKIYHKDKTQYDHFANWRSLNDIAEPKGFFAIVTKDVSKYNKYTKAKLNSGGAMPIIFNLANLEMNSRFYFEFFLSPITDISAKESIMKMQGLKFKVVAVGINEKMYLIIRCAQILVPEGFPIDRELGMFIS